MSKEMSTKEAIKILEDFSEKGATSYRNIGGKLEIVKPSYVQAIETVLAELQELGEINFNLLNNGLPKELFYELQEKLKKEKEDNEANKKRIKELEKEKKILKFELRTKQKTIEELLKDGGE